MRRLHAARRAVLLPAFLPAAASFLVAAVPPLLAEPAPSRVEGPVSAPDLKVLKCEEDRPAAFPGKAVFHVAVRNAAEVEALDATLVLKLFDATGGVVDTAYAKLDTGRVPAGGEALYAVTLPKCPDFKRTAPSVIWSTGTLTFSGGEFTTEPQLEAGACRFQRFSNGDLVVTGRVRNGGAKPAGAVTVAFAFKNDAGRDVKTAARTLSGGVAPNAVIPFFVRVPECPSIASYTVDVTGKDVDAAEPPQPSDANLRDAGPAAAAAKEESPLAGGLGNVVGPGPGREEKPPPAAAPAAPPPPVPGAPAEEPAYRIQAVGLGWVNGTYKFSGKKSEYTGDVAFLKLKFADAKGAPAKPEGTIILKIGDRGRVLGTTKRAMSKGAWRLNAQDLNAENAAPEIVAYNAKEDALWVGVMRSDDWTKAEIQIDLQVEIKKSGTWWVKALADPFKASLWPPEPGGDKKSK